MHSSILKTVERQLPVVSRTSKTAKNLCCMDSACLLTVRETRTEALGVADLVGVEDLDGGATGRCAGVVTVAVAAAVTAVETTSMCFAAIVCQRQITAHVYMYALVCCTQHACDNVGIARVFLHVDGA
eukprot:m.1637607 g.1637607  ORF g.1637607 m.1637607 type:complete len:128 (+) comp25978_c0_seq1:1249-1632(+)